MKEKKILIAGGTGFIGATLCPYLHSKGYDITVVDIGWFGNTLPKDIRYQERDLFDLRQEDLKGYDTVIFLAGLSNDPMAEYSPKDNFIYNTALPAYLGFMAREAGVKRMIMASSCSVYGYTQNRTFTEDDEAVCNYPYGSSKLQGEQALFSLKAEDFSVICLRQGTVCGFSPRMRLDLAINTMLKNAIQKKEITLSNAKIWRPILGLRDLCQAYEQAMNSDKEVSGIFNIASFNATVEELALETAAVLAEKMQIKVNIVDKKVQDYRNYKVTCQKALDTFGYTPDQTAKSIIEELLANLDTFKDFDNPAFYNIEVFKSLKNKPKQDTV